MGLCLLVITLGQRQLRQTLNRTKSTVKNQLGRPTNRPTKRLDISIPHSALQVYYNGIFNEEGGLQPLLLLITINSFCNMYFYLMVLASYLILPNTTYDGNLIGFENIGIPKNR